LLDGHGCLLLSPDEEHEEQSSEDVQNVKVNLALLDPAKPHRNATETTAGRQNAEVEDHLGHVALEVARSRKGIG
jgi:hypothetical protein